MSSRARVEGRDPHQAVDAALGLEPAIGVLAPHPHGERFEAGLLAGAFLQHVDGIAPRFGPARVHAGQHLRPVLRFGAAGAGVDLDEAVIGVGLAGEQAVGLHAHRAVAQRQKGGLGLGDDLVVPLGLAQLDEVATVPGLALERAMAAERVLDPRALAHHLARALGVVPERRVLDQGVQRGEPGLRSLRVKDASSAARATAQSRRGRFPFPRACQTTRKILDRVAGRSV